MGCFGFSVLSLGMRPRVWAELAPASIVRQLGDVVQAQAPKAQDANSKPLLSVGFEQEQKSRMCHDAVTSPCPKDSKTPTLLHRVKPLRQYTEEASSILT